MSYNVLHIFGYGQCQLIDTGTNKKILLSNVQSEVDAVVSDIYGQKPPSNTGTSDYHAITILKDMYTQYTSKNGKTFRVQTSLLNNTLIDNLATAISNA